MSTEYLHPVIYLGVNAEKQVTVPMSPAPVHFRPGPDYDKPYAYVKEAEAKYLQRIAPDKFKFPNGLGASDLADLVARIETLEAQVNELKQEKAEKPKRAAKEAEAA